MRPVRTEPRDASIAAALCFVLLSYYLLTFSGTLRSIDELALFGMTEGLVQSGRLQPVLVQFARFHNPVGAFEPGYPWLAAPLYWLAQPWPQVSHIHAVMLLNPALTAATGAVLYLAGRRLGYDSLASAAVALTFGLATMAWPYTKSFLREPAIGLLWTLSLLGVALFIERPGWQAASLAVIPAVLGAGIKAASIAAWPVLFILLAWSLYRVRRLRLAWLLGACAAGLLASFGAAAFLLAQRGIGLNGVIRQLLADPFSAAAILPWYGLLLSPGKSVFLYSPALLLGVLGWPAFYRRHGALAVGLVLLWASMLYVLRTSAWWGGLAWGPRFLLPLLPISLLPALELLPQRRWAVAVAGLSAAYQAVVASADWSRAYQGLFARYPGAEPDLAVGLDWSRWAESPAILLLRLWGRSVLDLVWLRTGLAEEIKLDAGLGLILAGLVCVTVLLLGVVWRGGHARAALTAGAAAVALAVPILLWRAYWDLPDYPGLTADMARQLAAKVSQDPARPSVILNVSPDFGTYPWLGLVKARATRIWVSPAEESGYEQLLPDTGGERLVVVVDRTHIASHYPGDRLVSWLNLHAYRMGSEWVEGFELFRYAAAANPSGQSVAGLRWPTGVALTRFGVPEATLRGSVLPVYLVFECLTDEWVSSDRLFTNLIGPDGLVTAGQESGLQYGNLASAGCRAGQEAEERRGLWIPPDAPPGQYALLIGFANAEGYVPASLAGGETADYVDLAEITIMR